RRRPRPPSSPRWASAIAPIAAWRPGTSGAPSSSVAGCARRDRPATPSGWGRHPGVRGGAPRSPSLLVLDGAAVGGARLLLHFPSGEQGSEGGLHVVGGPFLVAARVVVDRARVAEHALFVDHVHVRRGLGSVALADLA